VIGHAGKLHPPAPTPDAEHTRDVPHGPVPPGFGARGRGYPTSMLYTILIILAIVALLLFIFGRRRV
jgi:hypothetical protein